MAPPGARPPRARLPGEGPRRPRPDRARREAAAAVDRRGRLAGRRARAGRRAARKQRERWRGSWRGALGVVALRRSPDRDASSSPSPTRARCASGAAAARDDGHGLAARSRPTARCSRSRRATRRARTSIWVRPLRTTVAYQLQGTQSAGPAVLVARLEGARVLRRRQAAPRVRAGRPGAARRGGLGASDGTWGASGVVLFDGASGDSIRGIPATGGAVSGYASFDRKLLETQHAWPCFLPDGKHFLFQAFRSGGGRTNLIKLGTIGSLQSVRRRQLRLARRIPAARPPRLREGRRACSRAASSLATWKPTGDPIVIGENAGTTGNTEAFSAAEQRDGRVPERRRGRAARGPARTTATGTTSRTLSEPDADRRHRDVAGRHAARDVDPRRAHAEARPVDPRREARHADALHVRPGRRDLADVVGRRRLDRLRLGPQRRAIASSSSRPRGCRPRSSCRTRAPATAVPIQWMSSRGATSRRRTSAPAACGSRSSSRWRIRRTSSRSRATSSSTIEAPRISPDGRFVRLLEQRVRPRRRSSCSRSRRRPGGGRSRPPAGAAATGRRAATRSCIRELDGDLIVATPIARHAGGLDQRRRLR